MKSGLILKLQRLDKLIKAKLIEDKLVVYDLPENVVGVLILRGYVVEHTGRSTLNNERFVISWL